MKVEPTGDPTKCHITGKENVYFSSHAHKYAYCYRLLGNGINPNLKVGEEYTINIDTHGAGPGSVTGRIRSTLGNDIDLDIVDNEDGTFNLYYTPHNPGNYVIKIKFGGQDIPGGDFVVTVCNNKKPICSFFLRLIILFTNLDFFFRSI